MHIIDKARWHIDGGISEEEVIQHFVIVFEWLNSKGMLSSVGKEELEDGIDDYASLNERAVTPDALKFLDAKYDEYLAHIDETGEMSAAALDKLYNEYSK